MGIDTVDADRETRPKGTGGQTWTGSREGWRDGQAREKDGGTGRLERRMESQAGSREGQMDRQARPQAVGRPTAWVSQGKHRNQAPNR
jgi:hypothetical protein